MQGVVPETQEPVEMGNSQVIIKKMKTVPIFRGLGGAIGDSDNSEGFSWDIAGSGRRLKLFGRMLETGNLPEIWRDRIGEGFIKHVCKQQWTVFTCPSCSGNI